MARVQFFWLDSQAGSRGSGTEGAAEEEKEEEEEAAAAVELLFFSWSCFGGSPNMGASTSSIAASCPTSASVGAGSTIAMGIKVSGMGVVASQPSVAPRAGTGTANMGSTKAASGVVAVVEVLGTENMGSTRSAGGVVGVAGMVNMGSTTSAGGVIGVVVVVGAENTGSVGMGGRGSTTGGR
jgi:hypothetical protein